MKTTNRCPHCFGDHDGCTPSTPRCSASKVKQLQNLITNPPSLLANMVSAVMAHPDLERLRIYLSDSILLGRVEHIIDDLDALRRDILSREVRS